VRSAESSPGREGRTHEVKLGLSGLSRLRPIVVALWSLAVLGSVSFCHRGGRSISHPGSIEYVDAFMKTSRIESVAGKPDDDIFATVTIGGKEQRVPIVKVVLYTYDENGRPAHPDLAKSARITEYGPDGQELRTTQASVGPR